MPSEASLAEQLDLLRDREPGLLELRQEDEDVWPYRQVTDELPGMTSDCPTLEPGTLLSISVYPITYPTARSPDAAVVAFFELTGWVPDGRILGPAWVAEDRARYRVGPMTLHVNRVEGGWAVEDWDVECRGGPPPPGQRPT